MLEKLISLKIPPGLVNNGTPFQSRGRWVLGSLVRFFGGNIQPIGGWVQRTLTGATIAGVPNAAISWATNDGNAYLAVGTTTGLYIVTSANVVHDITPPLTDPTSFATIPAPPYQWQIENFGSYLLATFNLSTYTTAFPTAAVNLFAWRGDVTVKASPVAISISAPNSSFGLVMTPERFLFVFRGSDPVVLTSPPSDVVD